MARKLPRLQRALDAPTLASVAYGEIASSIYFALGIIALHALGLTPAVLAVVGLLFVIVALSYAEGTAAIRETGGGGALVPGGRHHLPRLLTRPGPFLRPLVLVAPSVPFFPPHLWPPHWLPPVT